MPTTVTWAVLGYTVNDLWYEQPDRNDLIESWLSLSLWRLLARGVW